MTVRSDGDGMASVSFRGVTTPGNFTVNVSVVNPADGATFTATAAVGVHGGTGDHEPNGDTGTAARLAFDRRVNGTIGASVDTSDVYRITSTTDGTVTATLAVPPSTSPVELALAFLSAAGAELQRITTTGGTRETAQSVPAGTAFVRIEAITGATPYALSATFVQAPVTVQSISPPAGGPGTTVLITGTGFSTDRTQNHVFFGEVAGKVVRRAHRPSSRRSFRRTPSMDRSRSWFEPAALLVRSSQPETAIRRPRSPSSAQPSGRSAFTRNLASSSI